MLDTLISIAPLFLLIALGRILYYFKIADMTWVQVFNAYTLKLGFPAMIFAAIYHSQQRISDYQHIFIANSGYLIGIFLLALIIFSKTKDKRTYVFCLIFNNIAFLGIPILKRIYGEQSSGETSFIASTYLILLFTLGIIYLETSRSNKINFTNLTKDLFKNPLLMAILIGIFFHLTKIKLPILVNDSIELIAHSVTPIILLSIGIFTGTISFGKLKELRMVIIMTLLTLILSPSLLFIVNKFTNSNLDLSIMEAAMPVAVAPFAMADSFNLNKNFIAKVVIISTICSAFTLTTWHCFLN